MTRILPGIGWRLEQFRAPEVADRLAVAVEHVQHRLLLAVWRLGQVIAVIGGPGRGQEPQSPPAALGGEGEYALDRRFGDDCEIDPLGGVLGSAVQLVEERGARWARTLGQR